MECQRAVIVKTQRSTSFGVRETMGGMALGMFLLGAGTLDLAISAPKWSFGDCHCQARPALTTFAQAYEPARASRALETEVASLPSPRAPLPTALPAAYAESPLPVASPEMAGARVGAEPEARLALSAFPSADPTASAPELAAEPSPAFNRATRYYGGGWSTGGAGAGDPNVGRTFAPAPELEAGGDDLLMPARRR